ncbi:hypothetical protein GO986_17335 [Deinococcus sp. HMF7620]|uniref:Uncharacterized protein n=1 Tax=Deinococcus arboris TaxID=2682977 RepID=A0A7C9IDR3_9DEIO|nr:hypothetical protein [Deinococcus arboris]MVN88506.1 hypothetical protein [Deinococcus arboris]
MLGWMIFVYQAPPDQVARNSPDPEPFLLAHWEAGLGGLAWLDDLVKLGKATQLRFDGYPARYTAQTADVLPQITSGKIRPANSGLWVFGIDEGEEYVQPPAWLKVVQTSHDRIAACPPDALLTIEAWDQS